MIRWTRRRLLGSAAVAACVGCAESRPTSTQSSELPEPTDPRADPFDRAIVVGSLDEVLASVAADGAMYVPEARAWITAVPADQVEAMVAAHDESLHAGLQAGLIALYQKCPHLGCRVPYCESSGWFECGCHGTMFTALGEHRDGPGERGMDAFPIVLDADTVAIRTGVPVTGQPAGSAIVDQPPVGPHCVTEGEH